MPIPPNPVHTLIDRVWKLVRLLDPDEEDGGSILQRLEQIELQQMDLINSQQRIENLLNLIIKLLSKE
jgi:hypothetical protein